MRLPVWLLKFGAEVLLLVRLEAGANSCMAELNRRGYFWSDREGWKKP